MHPVKKGDVTESMLIARFLRLGYTVLKPLSQISRYDLVIDRNKGDGFERIQCKTGKLKGGRIRFNTCSNECLRGGGRKNYDGEADYFGIYCFENDRCYLINVRYCGNMNSSLRLSRNDNKRIMPTTHWAEEYEIKFM